MNGEMARIRAEREREQLNALIELSKNPVVELAAGTYFILWLTKPPDNNIVAGILSGGVAATMFTALAAIIGLQQVAPALPYIPNAISNMLPALPSGG